MKNRQNKWRARQKTSKDITLKEKTATIFKAVGQRFASFFSFSLFFGADDTKRKPVPSSHAPSMNTKCTDCEKTESRGRNTIRDFSADLVIDSSLIACVYCQNTSLFRYRYLRLTGQCFGRDIVHLW